VASTTAEHTALTAWAWPDATLASADSGLINQTWIVRRAGTPVAVLQRLNTGIFSPAVHEDIRAITTRLAERGVPTPRLIATATGAHWLDDESGCWRCLSFLGDRTIHKLGDPADAEQAGGLVARFHTALAGFEWTFRSVRPGAHDTPAHMRRLAEAVHAHQAHRLSQEVTALANEIAARWAAWSGPTQLPTRIIHGDLKISNLRFQGDQALALVDLDTMAHGTIDVELGDAMRSWCNTASEDAADAAFDLAIFEAAMRGYASAGRLTGGEWESIVPGVQRIALELSARFARDALEEAYFGFDPAHGGHGEHNLLRARGQLSFARAVSDAATEARAIVRDLS
jgi:Ser/Thr protein kinase RdoA (MazF antagonist)